MCTVSIIPQGQNNFVLTSSRDEAPDRIALVPDFYNEKQVKMLYPKDEVGGGTWIGVSEKNRLICLLNGGFVKHKINSKYRHSRGVVVKDLLACDTIETKVQAYDLNNIEPFTIVIADWNTDLKFYELVWDFNKKHFSQLPLAPKIWSSSTLYDDMMKNERLNWFNTYKNETELTNTSMFNFHKTAGCGCKDYDVVMDRGFVKTTSITQVEKVNANVVMKQYRFNDDVMVSKTFTNE